MTNSGVCLLTRVRHTFEGTGSMRVMERRLPEWSTLRFLVQPIVVAATRRPYIDAVRGLLNDVFRWQNLVRQRFKAYINRFSEVAEHAAWNSLTLRGWEFKREFTRYAPDHGVLFEAELLLLVACSSIKSTRISVYLDETKAIESLISLQSQQL